MDEKFEKIIAANWPDARWYLCYFRQNIYDKLYVSSVYPQSYHFSERKQAESHAYRLEEECARRRDYDVVVEVRLASSRQRAKDMLFLDESFI